MRWLAGLVFVLALGTLRLVGCGDEGPIEYEYPVCRSYQDCADGYYTGDVWRANECTDDECIFGEGTGSLGTCEREDATDGDTLAYCSRPSSDPLNGVCVDGTCQPNPCQEQQHRCGRWMPRVSDGTCALVVTTRDWVGCRDGDFVGVCIEGSCVDDPCGDVVCDDGDLCTADTCAYPDAVCEFAEKTCFHQPTQLCRVARCDPEDGRCKTFDRADGTRCWYPIGLGLSFPGHCEQGLCYAL